MTSFLESTKNRARGGVDAAAVVGSFVNLGRDVEELV